MMNNDMSILCVCGKLLKREGGNKRIAPRFFKEHLETKYHKKRTYVSDEILMEEHMNNYIVERLGVNRNGDILISSTIIKKIRIKY